MFVTHSLRQLMAGLIDYAGLFPPAQLPLEPAIRNYAHYLAGAESWMLGRFILPASQLEALSPAWMAWFSPATLLDISLLVADLGLDLPRLRRWLAAYPAQARAQVMELRWAEGEDLMARLEKDQTHLAAAGVIATLYYELPFNAAWETRLPVAIHALATARRQGWAVGFKLRCGGVTPEMFPTSHQVALAVVACRDTGVPLKATAGLHHPLRRYATSIPAFMHGFVNLFGGGVLAHVHGWDLATMEAILLDARPAHFSFEATAFSWCGWTATPAQIATVRQTQLMSYGSCSFDEPRTDLAALGWLPAGEAAPGS